MRRRLLGRTHGRVQETKRTGTSERDPLDTLSFLPRRHSDTTPTAHNYPSVTSRIPQGGSPNCSTTSNNEQNGATPTTDATTRGRRRRVSGQRKGKNKKPRLSAHINPWTINNRQRRQQSHMTTPVATPPTQAASTTDPAKLPP
jgi:hypothetical protein